MNRFLAKSSFIGPGVGLRASGGSFVAQAKFNGCIMFSNWPRRDVAAALPPELELAENISAAADIHPVVFLFGEQTEGATSFGGFMVPLGVRYQEFGVAVPFVKHRRGRYLHVYILRMCSDYFPATWAGNIYYGFAKEMAKMRWEGPVFMLTTDAGDLLLHATVAAASGWLEGPACTLPNFAAMREIFSLPVVGQRADGAYVGSYFDWDFCQAIVRPADAYVAVDAAFVTGLAPRCCDDVAEGTFEVRGMIWRVSWPTTCRF